MPSLTPHPRGEFGFQAAVSAVELDHRDMLPLNRYHDLVMDGSYFYGGFADDEGRRYTLLRKVSGELSAGLVLNASNGEQLQASDRQADSMRGGTLRYEATSDAFRIRPSNVKGVLGEPFSFVHEGTIGVWDEGDIAHLEGTLVGGVGLQWYAAAGDDANLYVTHIHRASGTLLGRPVEGFFAFDQQYLKPGTVWRQTPYFQRLEVAWFTHGVEYDDGTVEVGQICHGGDDWGFAIMATQDGPAKLTTDISGTLTFRGDEFPERVDYLIDGEKWTWNGWPDGVMPAYAADPHYRPADGFMTRADETRSVVASFGWLDAFNDGRA